MRLIDADAEIVKIEKEITKINEKIKELEKRMIEESNNNIRVFWERISQYHKNIIDCKKEIKMLQQYPTAYDVDKVVGQLEELTQEECTLHECGIRSEKCKPCIAKLAIEIVKAGGVNG